MPMRTPASSRRGHWSCPSGKHQLWTRACNMRADVSTNSSGAHQDPDTHVERIWSACASHPSLLASTTHELSLIHI
eukprot:6678014-Alexandrium_andersonii.AAC.1